MTQTTNHTVINAAVEAAGMKMVFVRDISTSAISLSPSLSNTKQWIVTVLSLRDRRGCVVLVELSLFATPDTKVLSTFDM